MFKIVEADRQWTETNLERTCKETFNAEVIVAAVTKGKVELFWQSGSTDKFKFLLADFVKCLLLGVRSIFDFMSLNMASFIKSFQQVASNPLTGIPEPTFIKTQTLQEVFCDIVCCVAERFAGEDANENRHEQEQLVFLLQKYSRHVTTLLLSLDFAKDLIK